MTPDSILVCTDRERQEEELTDLAISVIPAENIQKKSSEIVEKPSLPGTVEDSLETPAVVEAPGNGDQKDFTILGIFFDTF